MNLTVARKRFVRNVALLYIAGLLIQTGVILGFGEPWPAIALPRFSDPGGGNQRFTTEEPHLLVQFSDSTQAELDHHRFLNRFPRAFHSAIMDKNFRNGEAGTSRQEKNASPHKDAGERTETWTGTLKERIRRAFRTPNVVPATTPEGRQWIRTRLKDLFPNRSPAHLSVEWYEITRIRAQKKVQVAERQRVSRLDIEL